MGRFVVGADRSQITLLPECLDDWVSEDNPVHVIEAFVEALDHPGRCWRTTAQGPRPIGSPIACGARGAASRGDPHHRGSEGR